MPQCFSGLLAAVCVPVNVASRSAVSKLEGVITFHGDKKINLVIEEVADGAIVNFLSHGP